MCGHALHEVHGEKRDVVAALPQRGQVDGEDLEAKEQVIPEGALPHHLRQVAVGRRHDREHRLDDETVEQMSRYQWPGNVRELEHAIERAIALAGTADVLSRDLILGSKPIPDQRPAAARVTTLRDSVEEAERAAIRAASKWQYVPPRDSGIDMPVVSNARISFVLEG